MIKEFYSLEEIQKYYDNETDTYIFKENGEYIELIKFNFDLYLDTHIKACDLEACDIKALDIRARDIDALDIKAWNINAQNIEAWDINACDISACNINAWNINAKNINARNINYYAVCFAYNDIKCGSIKGCQNNSKHFVLDGKLEVKNENKEAKNI